MTGDLRMLTTFARSHHGLFRVQDARRAGFSEHELRGLVASGWCDRPSRTVYRVLAAPATDRQALLVMVWANGEHAVASHRAAGRVWGLPGFSSAGPEVTRPHGENQRSRLVHGTLRLPPSHVGLRDGIPVTGVARTIFDIAGVVRPPVAERALDAALQRRLCRLEQVQNVFFSLARRGRRGTTTMRALLEARGVGYVAPASELERLARSILERSGLPMPEFEVDLGDDDDWIGRVDGVWRPERLILEIDSRLHHESLSDRRHDRKRDNQLMAVGWRVLRVTRDDLIDRPVEVLDWVARALAAAA